MEETYWALRGAERKGRTPGDQCASADGARAGSHLAHQRHHHRGDDEADRDRPGTRRRRSASAPRARSATRAAAAPPPGRAAASPPRGAVSVAATRPQQSPHRRVGRCSDARPGAGNAGWCGRSGSCRRPAMPIAPPRLRIRLNSPEASFSRVGRQAAQRQRHRRRHGELLREAAQRLRQQQFAPAPVVGDRA